ncbi:hypothetical protein T492DRAFT_871681 [Pavlovales sp. CCMP2436]|nr:hypothetical protein T492DRAFT_871681 [Pavlovales sp. CCMP2436]
MGLADTSLSKCRELRKRVVTAKLNFLAHAALSLTHPEALAEAAEAQAGLPLPPLHMLSGSLASAEEEEEGWSYGEEVKAWWSRQHGASGTLPSPYPCPSPALLLRGALVRTAALCAMLLGTRAHLVGTDAKMEFSFVAARMLPQQQAQAQQEQQTQTQQQQGYAASAGGEALGGGAGASTPQWGSERLHSQQHPPVVASLKSRHAGSSG